MPVAPDPIRGIIRLAKGQVDDQKADPVVKRLEFTRWQDKPSIHVFQNDASAGASSSRRMLPRQPRPLGYGSPVRSRAR